MTNLEKVRKQMKMTRFGLARKVHVNTRGSWNFFGAYQFIKFAESHNLILTNESLIHLSTALNCSIEEIKGV